VPPALAIPLLLLAGACSPIGPDYQRPEPAGAVPDAYASPGPWKSATPRDHLPRGRWWAAYGDPVLDGLLTTASDLRDGAGTPSLHTALARLDEARALAGMERAALWPEIGAEAGAGRARSEANRRAGTPGYTNDSYSLGVDLRYELDLWGRVRRSKEAAGERANAAAADFNNALLSLQTTVARAYFNLRALDDERELVSLYLQSQHKSLEIVRRRKALGADDGLDLSLAETEVHAAEGDLHEIERQRAGVLLEIAALCGKNPSGFGIAPDPAAARLRPPEIPVGLPSELLERRPDIAASERELHALTAEIGVARAAFYPAVTLFGKLGFASTDFATTLDWDSRFWALAPSISLPVFEGGRNEQNLRRAEARVRAATAAYRQNILNAFKEVETCLGDLRLLSERGEKLERAVAAGDRAAALVNKRYKGGSVSYMDVTVAERRAISIKRDAARVRGQQLSTSVLLVKAIGGGWDAAPGPSGTGMEEPRPAP
jgi:multidrug efflux system outer membrane protein